MDSRLVWFLILSLVVTALAIFASYPSLTAQWKTTKRWLLDSLVRPLKLVTAYPKLGVAILVLGLPVWHLVLLGVLTKGRFHGYTKMDNGGMISTYINPLSNRTTAQVTVPRRSLSLTDLTDLYAKRDLEYLLRIAHDDPSFLREYLKQKYDPYAMLLPYQADFRFTYLVYSLRSGTDIKVWAVSRLLPSQRNESPYILEYESDLNLEDLQAMKEEVSKIWEEFRTAVEKTDYKRAGIIVRGFVPMKSGGSGEMRYAFSYTKGDDGVWRAAAGGSTDS